MKTIIHKANSRGHANHRWLNTYHSFSFANYHNPERMNFGALRVLNDDVVAQGQGFGKHPHENMEIVSIPLKGKLAHQDSMDKKEVITKYQIQVMSAGSGIWHSEFNDDKNNELKFLQIWVETAVQKVTPKYNSFSFLPEERINKWQRLVSPQGEGEAWIYQNAYFSISELGKGKTLRYLINKKGNGVYSFLIDGKVDIEGIKLEKRDGMGIWEIDQLSVGAIEDSEILLIEVPI